MNRWIRGQMPNKEKQSDWIHLLTWQHVPCTYFSAAHSANLIRNRLHIYPLLTTVQIAKICFIHFLTLTHLVHKPMRFSYSPNTHQYARTHTPRTNREQKSETRIMGKSRTRFNGCFFFFLCCQLCLSIFIWRDQVYVCSRLLCVCFAVLHIHTERNHIWIKIRVISTCCVYNISMINHPKLDGMLYIYVIYVMGGSGARHTTLYAIYDCVPLQFSHNVKYMAFFYILSSCAFFGRFGWWCCCCLFSLSFRVWISSNSIRKAFDTANRAYFKFHIPYEHRLL